jgi:hypothetical protein
VACDDRRKALREFFAGPAPKASGSYSKHDMIPISKAIGERLARLYPWGTSIRVSLRNAHRDGSISRRNAKRILADHPEIHDEELLRTWFFFVHNEKVRWDQVVSYEETDRVETGYDLTVPGYETFMAVDGTILSNTLQVHTPVLPAAVEDVKRMTLSNLLFADKQRDDLLVAPRMEAMLGLHLATRPPSEKVHRFRTPDQALAAYKRGEVALNDQVELG